MALSGTVAVVGSPFAAPGGVTDAGAAYVFEDTPMGWTEVAVLTAPDLLAGDFFGESVTVSGDLVLVGSGGDDDASICTASCASGSVYAFRKQGSEWVLTSKLRSGAGVCNHGFGIVSAEGDHVLVGAWAADPSQQGAAYAFVGAPETVGGPIADGLSADAGQLSLSSGGVQELYLTPGVAFAGQGNLVLGTMSGTSPGLAIHPVHLDLNLDAYLLQTISAPPGQGVLCPVTGTAGAQVVVPGGLPPTMAGVTFHHAYLVFGTGPQPLDFVSDSVPLALVP